MVPTHLCTAQKYYLLTCKINKPRRVDVRMSIISKVFFISMFQVKFLLFHIFKHITSMLLYTYCYELTYTSKRILNVVSDTNVISLNYDLKTYYLMVFFLNILVLYVSFLVESSSRKYRHLV